MPPWEADAKGEGAESNTLKDSGCLRRAHPCLVKCLSENMFLKARNVPDATPKNNIIPSDCLEDHGRQLGVP